MKWSIWKGICFMSSSAFVSVCVCLCVSERKQEPCNPVRTPAWTATSQQHRAGEQAISRHRAKFLHKPQSPTWRHTTKPKGRQRDIKGGKASLLRFVLSLSSKTHATVRHGRVWDWWLVEAVSVAGRGNALINPVRVKDTGTCKADPGFVLHCLWFRVTATT